jgi:hypothetical protein
MTELSTAHAAGNPGAWLLLWQEFGRVGVAAEALRGA